MTTPGLNVACDLPCELRIGEKQEAARVRSCSLSRCFVQTEVPWAVGTLLDLTVSGPDGRRSSVQALVQRAVHERWIEDESMRGLELRLLEVGPSFFSLYADLCDGDREDDSRSLPLGIGRESQERRRAGRSRIELPVRVFGTGLNLVGATRDLSPTGAFIESDTPRSLAERLHLEFLSERSFFAESCVVRVVPTGVTGFAVRFVPMQELIDSWRQRPETGDRPALQLRVGSVEELGWLYAEQIKKSALFVPGHYALELNALVEVALEFQDTASHTVRGRVIRVFDQPPGIGLQLLHREAAAAWCEARLRGQD